MIPGKISSATVWSHHLWNTFGGSGRTAVSCVLSLRASPQLDQTIQTFLPKKGSGEKGRDFAVRIYMFERKSCTVQEVRSWQHTKYPHGEKERCDFGKFSTPCFIANYTLKI